MKNTNDVDRRSAVTACYAAIRSSVGVWMAPDGACVSVARMIAIEAMQAMGLDPTEWRLRDKIIMAISDRVNGTMDFVANEDIFRRAMESMAAQFVCPKMTALEMARMQLKDAVARPETWTAQEKQEAYESVEPAVETALEFQPYVESCPICGGVEFVPPIAGTIGRRCVKCCDVSDQAMYGGGRKS